MTLRLGPPLRSKTKLVPSVAPKRRAESGKRGIIKIAGNSMSPLLCNGSKVIIELSTEGIKWGDTVVFHQGDNLITHRIVRVKKKGNVQLFQTKGDNALNFDPHLIGKGELMGKVIGLVRDDAIVDLASGWWQIGGQFLALYSYFVGLVVKTIKFCTNLIFKDKKFSSCSLGGRVLLFASSIFPRAIFCLLQFKLRKIGLRG